MDKETLERAVAIIDRCPGITVGELAPRVGLTSRRRSDFMKALRRQGVQLVHSPIRETKLCYAKGYLIPLPRPLFIPVPGYVPPQPKVRAATREEIGDYRPRRKGGKR